MNPNERNPVGSVGRRRIARTAEPKTGFSFDARILARAGGTNLDYPSGQTVFAQGDPADAVYYITRGKVKLSVVSTAGREAVLALVGVGSFFGEACLARRPLRLQTATTIGAATLVRIWKQAVIGLLRQEPAFTETFMMHLLSRTMRVEEDLADQLFNSSEKRLARVLLLLANFGKKGKSGPSIPKISQETLAEMIGTTRSRVSFFMNKFRKLGFIDYNGGLSVNSSLLSVLLLDAEPTKSGVKAPASKAPTPRKK